MKAGYGLRVYYFDNGTRNAPTSTQHPILLDLMCRLLQTSNGQAFHQINYDATRFQNSKWRLNASILLGIKVNANYFGLGAQDADRGLTDNKNKQYKTALDYENFLQQQ